MKYALVNEDRQEAQTGLPGKCPSCASTLIAKCGPIKVNYWSHHNKPNCDPWWENETEWHRAWKGHFPKEWQELVQHDEKGAKHIADVKTDLGYVIEFQHSPIKSEERQSREHFYKRMLWIVNGKRRLRDKDKFADSWLFANSVAGKEDLRQTSGPRCPLLRDWCENSVPVFFDFGEDILWGLLPKTTEGKEYLFKIPKAELIAMLELATELTDSFGTLIKNHAWTVSCAIAASENRRRVEAERNGNPFLGLHIVNTRISNRPRY